MWNWIKLSGAQKLAAAWRSYIAMRGNYTLFGIPDPQTDLKAPLEEFDTALNLAADKNTGEAATQRKKAAEKAFNKAFRTFGNRYIENNPTMTDEYKAMIDWHIRKKAEEIKVPTTYPLILVITAVLRQLMFKCFVKPSDKRSGKPKNTAAFVIYYAILDHEPTGIAELIHRASTSGWSITLDFTEADRGKKLYYVGCWQIARDELEGPKSPIEMVVIP